MSNFNASVKSASAIYFTFNHINKTIVGSEFNFKMSGNPTKPQYEALMNAMAMQPTYTLAPIASTKKVEKKQTYAGLTMELMEGYLAIYQDKLAVEMRTKFAELKTKHAKKEISYPTIKSWFLDLFPNFNVNKAKKAIHDKKLLDAKEPYKVVKVSVHVPQPADQRMAGQE